MANRRDDLLDAAITVLGERGIRGLTHRAVDTAAGLPAGSASNYFRTSDTLLNAVVQRFADRERTNWEDLAASMGPTTPGELAHALAAFVLDSVGPNRTLTMARYAILVEAAIRPQVREQLAAAGSRVRAYFLSWLRIVGSPDPQRDFPIVANAIAGMVLHQLAYPDPEFDPTHDITVLIEALTRTALTRTPTARKTHVKEAPWTVRKSGASSTPSGQA